MSDSHSPDQAALWFGVPVTRMSRTGQAWLWWAALLAWASVILWLSTLPPRTLPDTAFLLSDKVNHLLAYAVGGWLAASALRASRPAIGRVTAAVVAIGLIAAFGVLDEAVQTLTPGRTGLDAADWAADVIGASTGALLTAPRRRRSRLP